MLTPCAEMEDVEKKTEEEAPQVQVQIRKQQSERQLAALQNSYAYKTQQFNAEKWRELAVHGAQVSTGRIEPWRI